MTGFRDPHKGQYRDRIGTHPAVIDGLACDEAFEDYASYIRDFLEGLFSGNGNSSIAFFFCKGATIGA